MPCRNMLAGGLSGVCLSVVCLLSQTGQAQWITQRIPLSPGWNAICLKVTPADTSCAAMFSDAAITQVAWWNRDRLDDGTGSFVTDFCYWYRNGETPSTFGRVIGGQRYLVYSTANRPYFEVVGIPVVPSGTLYLGEPNLVGLNVPNNASDGPSFMDYFKDCKSLWNGSQPWYGVNATNGPAYVRDRTLITNASQAVWFRTAGSGKATFTGPFTVSLDKSDSFVRWTDNTDPRTITIRNASSVERVLRIDRISSMPPPTGQGTCVGDVRLLIESIDWSEGYAKRIYGTCPFPFITNIAAGATVEFRVKPDVAEMPAAEGNYMSILGISDKGSTIDGEVRAVGTCSYLVGLFSAGTLAANEKASAAGLWVGTVVLGQVNRAKMLGSSTPEWDPEALMTAPHPFQFRLIVHVAADGTAKILKQVFTAKRAADADHSDLLTDRDTAIAYRGLFPNATIRRTASANFPFMTPLQLVGGTFMAPDAEMTATFTQEYDDKTNPFVHSFHPQHDNVEFRNKTPYVIGSGDEGVGEYESWGVTRQVTLKFLADDPSSVAGQNWNRTVTGGEYTERVSGLIGQGKPIITKGIFRLSKVCDTPELTTEVIH